MIVLMFCKTNREPLTDDEWSTLIPNNLISISNGKEQNCIRKCKYEIKNNQKNKSKERK